MIKLFLKYAFYFLGGILLALFVAPFVFKDRVLKEVKIGIEKHVNAKVDFSDLDLSFINSFPEVSVSLDDFQITGIDTFEGIKLIAAKKLNMDFSLIPFFKKNAPMVMKYVGIENAFINVLILNDSTANYNITKPNDSASTFQLDLENYEIGNSHLNYMDHSLALKIICRSANHKGSGNLSEDIYDLSTSTVCDSLTFIYDGFTYVKNVNAKLSAKLNVNFPDQKYSLKDSKLTLNKLEVEGNGFVQFLKNDDVDMVAQFKSKKQSFRNFISVLPFLSTYNVANANGNMVFNGAVKGIYNSAKEKYPAFEIYADIENGSAQFAKLSKQIKNVFAKIKLRSSKSNLSDFELDISKLNAEVDSEKISGNLKIQNGLNDPHYSGTFVANIKAENWIAAIPLNGIEAANGTIDANINFDAKESDIVQQRYNKIIFDGKLDCKDIKIKSILSPLISIPSIRIAGKPESVQIDVNGAQLGKSDLNLKGQIDNPMAWFSEQKHITGKLNIKSHLLDINEWVNEDIHDDNSISLTPDLTSFKFSEVDATAQIDKFVYGQHELSNIIADCKFGLENIEFRKLNARYNESNLAINGKLANVYSYLFKDGYLVGDINLAAPKFDVNNFMVRSSEDNISEDSILFEVPEKVNLKISAAIGELKYSNLDLKDFVGNALVKDKTILLSGLKSQSLGGKIGFDGLYSTKEARPIFNIKLDLSRIEFLKAFEKFVTMKQIAPVAKYIQGVFNTTLVMEGRLNKGLIPDLSSLTASGFLETLNGIIKGFKPLTAAGQQLGVNQLGVFELKDTRNWFDIKNGVVEIKEFTKSYAGIEMRIKGSHKIQGNMAYEIMLKIPRTMLKQNAVSGSIENAYNRIEKEAAKRGVNISQGEFIDLKVTLSGTLSAPSVSIIPVSSSGKTMKDEVEDEIKNRTAEVKDSLTKVIVKRSEDIKDTIRNRASEELEKAKKKAEDEANKILNEAKEKAKKEVEAKLDTLFGKSVSDSLKRKTGEIIKDKTGKEIDDIKNKVKDWNPFKKKKKDGG